MEERRKMESDLKRRLERELDDLERELRGTREEMDLQIIASKKEKRELQASLQLTIDAKQKVCTDNAQAGSSCKFSFSLILFEYPFLQKIGLISSGK